MKRKMLRDPDRSSPLHTATSGLALAAVVVATVAIVVPEIGAVAGGGARSVALGDANAIGAALSHAIADLGDPREASAGSGPQWLFGPGILPKGSTRSYGRRYPLSGVLASDRIGAGVRWRGPYLESVPIDPWGRAYVVLLPPQPSLCSAGDPGLCAGKRDGGIVIVSAGPDGVVDTPPGSATIADDDVGVVLMP
jgi:hypothetical protein